MQALHIPTYIHTYWQCFLLCSPYIFLASFVLSFLVAFEVPRICNWLQLIAKCIGLKIEDSQKNFFNPGLGWRLKILRKTSSIQVWLHIFNPGLDWRSFSENLQSSIFNPGLGTYIDRWCSGTNQSTAWIATWNQPTRLPHIPCRPCKALGTSQTNLLCSRKNQQHEPSHQWTYCSPQKRIVCVPPCIKSRQYPKHFPTSPRGQYCAGSLLLIFRGQKRSGAFRRIWPSAALGKLLKLRNQAICISRCRNRCSFAL